MKLTYLSSALLLLTAATSAYASNGNEEQFLASLQQMNANSTQTSAAMVAQLAEKYSQGKNTLSFINAALNHEANKNYQWHCTPSTPVNLDSDGAIQYSQVQCSGVLPHKGNVNVTIHLSIADLDNPNVKITPALAGSPDPNAPYTDTVAKIAAATPNAYSCINGGYFYINPKGKGSFFDSNCPKKHGHQTTTEGVGDGLLVINNKTYSTNCPELGITGAARATIMQNSKGDWTIASVKPGVSPQDIQNALGAGPQLIDNSKIDMQWQQIPSTFEYAANTAAALANGNGKQYVVLFTVDGADNKSGLTATAMTNWLQTMLPQLFKMTVTKAMSMDQGGSTTMVIRDPNKGLEVVSKASTHGTQRPVYDALCVTKI